MADASESMTRSQVVSLVAVSACSMTAWSSLNDLIGHAHLYAKTGWLGEAYRPWFWLHLSWAIAAIILHRSGLFAFTNARARSAGSVGLGGWLVHFKLSLLALASACAAGWWFRRELLMWWLRPLIHDVAQSWSSPEWSIASTLDFGAPSDLIRSHALVVLSTMWLAALPFLAAELWGLLVPRSPRAQALRVPFGFATGLSLLLVTELVRHYGLGPFIFVVAISDDSSLI